MRVRAGRVGLVLLAVGLGLLCVPALGAASSTPAASSTTVQGNLTGPSAVATLANATFYLNASGGPGDYGGTFSGSISWNASLAGANTTGSTVTPTTGTITGATTQPVALTVSTGASTGTLRLVVRVTSSLGKVNSTANLSAAFQVIVPYVVQATLVAGPRATVLPFNVTVALDGATVGTVKVPRLAPNATYALAFRYASTGVGSGSHTFTLTIADAHGLVTFSNGLTVQTVSFYVAPPPTNDTIWYVTGVVAFFGVLFIYATRVAARRQGSGRR